MSFEYNDGTRSSVPLLIGITGYSGSGKTYSSCRIATGMQRVIGKDIAILDTESKRALQLADSFKFKHVPMNEPFSSLRYLEALQFCKSKGASIVIVDSMTHEHSSVGGYLDQSEKFLDAKCGDDDAKRHRFMRQSWIKPSRERKALNDWIVHCGMNIIFCYRAKEKMDSNFKSVGWQPETTSALIWEMTARFLLTPGSDGRPTFNPDLALEKMLTKNPEFFRGWFKSGQQLDENLGQKLAEWAKGGIIKPEAIKSAPVQNTVPQVDSAQMEPGSNDSIEEYVGVASQLFGSAEKGFTVKFPDGQLLSTPHESVIEFIKKNKGVELKYLRFGNQIVEVKK